MNLEYPEVEHFNEYLDPKPMMRNFEWGQRLIECMVVCGFESEWFLNGVLVGGPVGMVVRVCMPV